MHLQRNFDPLVPGGFPPELPRRRPLVVLGNVNGVVIPEVRLDPLAGDETRVLMPGVQSLTFVRVELGVDPLGQQTLHLDPILGTLRRPIPQARKQLDPLEDLLKLIVRPQPHTDVEIRRRRFPAAALLGKQLLTLERQNIHARAGSGNLERPLRGDVFEPEPHRLIRRRCDRGLDQFAGDQAAPGVPLHQDGRMASALLFGLAAPGRRTVNARHVLHVSAIQLINGEQLAGDAHSRPGHDLPVRNGVFGNRYDVGLRVESIFGHVGALFGEDLRRRRQMDRRSSL